MSISLAGSEDEQIIALLEKQGEMLRALVAAQGRRRLAAQQEEAALEDEGVLLPQLQQARDRTNHLTNMVRLRSPELR